jgi:hypothetical protein
MTASAAFSHARYLAVFTRPPRETFKNRLLTDREKRKIAEKGFPLTICRQPFRSGRTNDGYGSLPMC